MVVLLMKLTIQKCVLYTILFLLITTSMVSVHSFPSSTLGDLEDIFEYNEIGYAVRSTDDGYLIAGTLQTKNETTSKTDLLLIKTNTLGQEQWNKVFECSYSCYDLFTHFEFTYNDSVVVTSSTPSGMLLTKIDSNGNKLWDNIYLDGDSRAYCVKETHDHGYILSGYTYTDLMSVDATLVKVNESGGFEWSRSFDVDTIDIPMDVIQTQDHGYAFVGFSYDDVFTASSFLVKTNDAGDKQWHKTYGGPVGIDDTIVVQTQDQGFAIIGDDYLSYNPSVVVIRKTDDQGNTEWVKTYADMTYGYFVTSALLTTDNEYVINGVYSDPSETGRDTFVMKINETGSQQWTQCYDLDLLEVPYDIQPTSDQGFIITGTHSANDSFKKANSFLLKIDHQGQKQWFQSIGKTWSDIYPPEIMLISPENALYIDDENKGETNTPIIIGDITVMVNATDHHSPIDHVAFFVDDILMHNDSDAPFSWVWKRDRMRFRLFAHRQILRIVAYDTYGNTASTEVTLWKFF